MKKKGQLYNILLQEFTKYKDQGQSYEAAFANARLALIDYFCTAPNVGKTALRHFWDDMQNIEFTQQLGLDYALNKRKTAAEQLRPHVG